MRIVEEVARLLWDQDKTIALAEASTCGLVSYRLGTVPGASRYLKGSVIAYANSVKEEVLGVPQEVFKEGAVSAAVALEMARRVRQLLKADLGVATTGIAGPAGGTPEKPVGLTYVALSAADGVESCTRYLWKGDRRANQEQTSRAALKLMERYLRTGSF